MKNQTLIATLEMMRDEMDSHRLEIALVPAPRPQHIGHMVRVRCDVNCRWYRDFCASFPSSRRRRNPRSDTAIRRADTFRALSRMIEGENGGPAYGPRLIDAARRFYRANRAEIDARAESETCETYVFEALPAA